MLFIINLQKVMRRMKCAYYPIDWLCWHSEEKGLMLVAVPDWCHKNEDAPSYLSGLGSKMSRRFNQAKKNQGFSSRGILFAARSLFTKLHNVQKQWCQLRTQCSNIGSSYSNSNNPPMFSTGSWECYYTKWL